MTLVDNSPVPTIRYHICYVLPITSRIRRKDNISSPTSTLLISDDSSVKILHKISGIPIRSQISSTVRSIRSQSLHQYQSSDNRSCHKYCIFTYILKFLLNITSNGYFSVTNNKVLPTEQHQLHHICHYQIRSCDRRVSQMNFNN